MEYIIEKYRELPISKTMKYYSFLFIAASISGWCMEIVFRTVVHRQFIVPGFLLGPYCPIYGTGALLALFLGKHAKKGMVIVKIVAAATILEYVVSFFAEKMFGRILWDYSNLPLSIGTRVSLVFSLAWGVLGIAFLQFLEPLVRDWFEEHQKFSVEMSMVIGTVMCIDGFLTIFAGYM